MLVAGLALLGSAIAGTGRAVLQAEPARPASETSISGSVAYVTDAARKWPYGRYYIRDRKSGRLAEAIVCLTGHGLAESKAGTAEPRMHAMDQKDFRFTPEILVVRAGDRVRFTNSDQQVHNVNARGGLQDLDESVAPGGGAEVTFPKAGGPRRPVVLGCKFHSVMRAWIYVFDHPFYAVTGADGTFQLANVPPGRYTLQVLHPAGGLRASQPVEVQAGKKLQVELRLGPDDKFAD